MIHDFGGSPVTERSPRIMRKKSRPLSIIDENLEDWTRGSQENDAPHKVGDGRDGDASVKVTTDDTSGNNSVNDVECASDTSEDAAAGHPTATLSTAIGGKVGDVSEETTESEPSGDTRRRRSSLRRVAVAPLEHPVFALAQGQGGILNDTTQDGALHAEKTRDNLVSEVEESHTSIIYNGTKHSLQDASLLVSGINETSQNDAMSSDDSDLDLDIGYRATHSVDKSVLAKSEPVHSKDRSFAENGANNRVCPSYIQEQLSDSLDSEEGDVQRDSQRDHERIQNGSQNALKGKSLDNEVDISATTGGNVIQSSKRNGFSVYADRDKNRSKSVTHTYNGVVDNHDNDWTKKGDKAVAKGPSHSGKGDVLDKEQLAWKNRVRQSFSFTYLSNKFRPLRRSMSSCEAKRSAPAVESERPTDLSRKYSDTVRFYLPDGSPRLQHRDEIGQGISTNTFSLEGSLSGRGQPSAQNLSRVRKYSWQDFRSASKGHDLGAFAGFRRTSLDHTKQKGLGTSFENFSKWMKSRDQANQSSVRSLHHNNQQPDNENNKQQGNQSNTTPIRRISAIDQSDFSLLKATATRLNLPTRRPSTMAWRAQYVDNQSFLTHPVILKDTDKLDNVEHVNDSKVENDVPLTAERKNRINESLSWLRQELINIRLQDQALARQFLGIRHTMNKLRLAAECEGHKELLDNAEEDMEELRELSRLVDIPTELLSPMPTLQHLGVTRMNLTARRFSTC